MGNKRSKGFDVSNMKSRKPVLIMAIGGAILWFRERIDRRELVGIALIVVTLFIINSSFNGWDGGFGADVTFYRTPDALRSAYGDHPVSFHLFFRLRPPAGSMGRMWNMRMSQPMLGHTDMPMNHPMP